MSFQLLRRLESIGLIAMLVLLGFLAGMLVQQIRSNYSTERYNKLVTYGGCDPIWVAEVNG